MPVPESIKADERSQPLQTARLIALLAVAAAAVALLIAASR